MSQMNRLTSLMRSKRSLFRTQDLALLWDVENRSTLYTIIKRYIQKKVLIKVIKGLYSTIPVEQIDLRELGSMLIPNFCYLSCESVLEKEGIINQVVYALTFVSPFWRRIKFGDNFYVYRKLDEKYLFNPEGVNKEGDYFVATKDRAVADMLYFNPKYYFDSPTLIDWPRVYEIQKKVGYKK